MSVINQMLIELEKRGVQSANDQVRPVHEEQARSRQVWLLAFLLIAALSAWYFLALPRQPVVAAVPLVVASQVAAASEVVAVSGVIAESGVTAVSGVVAISGVEAASGVIAVPEVSAVIAASVVNAASDVKALPEVKALTEVKPVVEKSRMSATMATDQTAKDTPSAKSEIKVSAYPQHPKIPGTHVAKKAVEAGEPPRGETHSMEKPVAVPAAQAIKQVSAEQQANADFVKAGQLVQQGNSADALPVYEAVLRQSPGHEAARRALIRLLLDAKRATEAEQLLQDGLSLRPANSGFAMLLARLQVARGALDLAIETLEMSLPHAVQQAEYQAFYAALLQRKGRHQDAIEHYQQALKIVPNSGVWLMGYGISLQALARPAEAKQAYQQALDAKTLSADLQSFVQQKISSM
jgi:MSHA biogenesis protein MshN